jgi:hypothetical protein
MLCIQEKMLLDRYPLILSCSNQKKLLRSEHDRLKAESMSKELVMVSINIGPVHLQKLEVPPSSFFGGSGLFVKYT